MCHVQRFEPHTLLGFGALKMHLLLSYSVNFVHNKKKKLWVDFNKENTMYIIFFKHDTITSYVTPFHKVFYEDILQFSSNFLFLFFNTKNQCSQI